MFPLLLWVEINNVASFALLIFMSELGVDVLMCGYLVYDWARLCLVFAQEFALIESCLNVFSPNLSHY